MVFNNDNGEFDAEESSPILSSMNLEELTLFIKGKLASSQDAERKAELLSRRSALDLFWAGAALCRARGLCKHGEWSKFKSDHCLADTTANDAIRLYKNAKTPESLDGLGITEAKEKFVYRKKDKLEPISKNPSEISKCDGDAIENSSDLKKSKEQQTTLSPKRATESKPNKSKEQQTENLNEQSANSDASIEDLEYVDCDSEVLADTSETAKTETETETETVANPTASAIRVEIDQSTSVEEAIQTCADQLKATLQLIQSVEKYGLTKQVSNDPEVHSQLTALRKILDSALNME